MDVRNCKQCGRLFNYIGGAYGRLCPDCINELENKFQTVKDYIEEHKITSMHELCDACDVSAKQIEQWIREDRLVFADDSPIGIACESCGTTIKSGRFCENCKTNMVNQFGSAYSVPKAVDTPKKVERQAARMRFLDN